MTVCSNAYAERLVLTARTSARVLEPHTVLLAVTGIAEAGSLARYARHVSGISPSKGALRARWRAERTR